MLVRIIKDWTWHDFMRQTPGKNGRWGEIEFTLDPVAKPDYLVILNRVPENMVVEYYPGHIWALIQEPPIREMHWMRKGYHQFDRIYTPDVKLRGEKYIYSPPYVPWHVNKNYDELISCSSPENKVGLSWVTSNINYFTGHRKRMEFLHKIQNWVDFDLWGRGFRPLEDKWDGLAPYRYSLAIENYHGPFYWSEKLADCFLSWTMPIYYGCTNILDFFPAEAMIRIDIDDPDVVRIIQDSVRSDLWYRNREAIAHARQIILNQYQFFPFMAKQILENEMLINPRNLLSRQIALKGLPWHHPDPLWKRLKWLAYKAIKRLLGKY